jgi:hypothetical protein
MPSKSEALSSNPSTAIKKKKEEEKGGKEGGREGRRKEGRKEKTKKTTNPTLKRTKDLESNFNKDNIHQETISSKIKKETGCPLSLLLLNMLLEFLGNKAKEINKRRSENIPICR